MRGGVIDPIISENRINSVYMPFYAKGHKEAAGDIAARYAATYNSISAASIESMKNNILGDNCILRYFAINHKGTLYIAKSEKHYNKYYIAPVQAQ